MSRSGPGAGCVPPVVMGGAAFFEVVQDDRSQRYFAVWLGEYGGVDQALAEQLVRLL
ncbi:hypothetical protein ACF1G3_37565 [Streptomyces rochei]|uniref:hypothetical protein n=1 Tax=Streptomyces rochei TaxID=1928 RepID=UPI0036FB31DE